MFLALGGARVIVMILLNPHTAANGHVIVVFIAVDGTGTGARLSESQRLAIVGRVALLICQLNET